MRPQALKPISYFGIIIEDLMKKILHLGHMNKTGYTGMDRRADGQTVLTTTRPKIAAQMKAAVMMSHSNCITVYPCLTIHNSLIKHFIYSFYPNSYIVFPYERKLSTCRYKEE